jgi:hypothetical protein
MLVLAGLLVLTVLLGCRPHSLIYRGCYIKISDGAEFYVVKHDLLDFIDFLRDFDLVADIRLR